MQDMVRRRHRWPKLWIMLIAVINLACFAPSAATAIELISTQGLRPPPETVAKAYDAGLGPSPEGRAILAVVPDELMGLDEAAIERRLGLPVSQENQPPTMRLDYRLGRCTLKIVMNPEVETHEFRAIDCEIVNDADVLERAQYMRSDGNPELPIARPGRFPRLQNISRVNRRLICVYPESNSDSTGSVRRHPKYDRRSRLPAHGWKQPLDRRQRSRAAENLTHFSDRNFS